MHQGLEKGQSTQLREPDPATIRAKLGIATSAENNQNRNKLRYSKPFRLDNYQDPVSGYGGAWSVVFAAADAAGYLVAVQSRRDTTPFVTALLAQAAQSSGLFLVVSVFILILQRAVLRRA